MAWGADVAPAAARGTLSLTTPLNAAMTEEGAGGLDEGEGDCPPSVSGANDTRRLGSAAGAGTAAGAGAGVGTTGAAGAEAAAGVGAAADSADVPGTDTDAAGEEGDRTAVETLGVTTDAGALDPGAAAVAIAELRTAED